MTLREGVRAAACVRRRRCARHAQARAHAQARTRTSTHTHPLAALAAVLAALPVLVLVLVLLVLLAAASHGDALQGVHVCTLHVRAAGLDPAGTQPRAAPPQPHAAPCSPMGACGHHMRAFAWGLDPAGGMGGARCMSLRARSRRHCLPSTSWKIQPLVCLSVCLSVQPAWHGRAAKHSCAWACNLAMRMGHAAVLTPAAIDAPDQ